MPVTIIPFCAISTESGVPELCLSVGPVGLGGPLVNPRGCWQSKKIRSKCPQVWKSTWLLKFLSLKKNFWIFNPSQSFLCLWCRYGTALMNKLFCYLLWVTRSTVTLLVARFCSSLDSILTRPSLARLELIERLWCSLSYSVVRLYFKERRFASRAATNEIKSYLESGNI